MPNMWNFTCPICGEEVPTDYTIDEVKDCIGFTTDCYKCGGLLMINDDLTCRDFGKELAQSYKDYGIDVTPEQAAGNYVEACIYEDEPVK